jgi:large subunit ribosomal protein L30
MARIRTKEKPKQAKKGTKIQLKWFRSLCQAPTRQALVIKGLGFTHLNQVIEREDTLSIRGMVAKVPHLVQIVGEKLYRDQK